MLFSSCSITVGAKLTRLLRSLSAVICASALLATVLIAAQVIAQGTVIDPTIQEPLLQVVGELADGRMGHAVVSGDVNGDGYDDLLVSAPYATVISGSVTYTESGAVYLYLGYEDMSGTLYLSTTTPNLTFFSDCRGFAGCQDWAGSDLAMGDMNGDGMDDIMIGVERYHGTPGGAFVFVGRKTLTSGIHITLDIQSRAQTSEWGYSLGIVGAWATDRMGRSVASGDVNGDSYDDLIIGAHLASPYTGTSPYYPDLQRHHGAGPFDRSFAGAIYLSAGWEELTKTAELPAYDYLKCLDSLTVYGIDDYDFLGRSVASGDVDGDGLNDIIVGANGGDLTDPQGEFGDNSGEVYVFWGTDVITRVQVGDDTPDCHPGLSSFTAYTNQIVIDLAYTATVRTNGITVGHTADITIYGAFAGGGAGYGVSSGDINGDGYDDIIVGAPGESTQTGWVHVIYGGERASFASTLYLSETADLTIVGEDQGDELGGRVSAADLNGDGYDDLIVGATGSDYGARSDAGKAYVFYGTAGDGLAGTIDLGAGVSGTLYLTKEHSAHVIFVGENNSDGAGKGLGAGDLNHDGILDLLVGAPFFNASGSSDEGSLYALIGDAVRGVTLTGELDTVLAGEPATYTLAAWNLYADWDVTAGGVFTLASGAGGGCVNNVCTPTQAGTWTVQGTFNASRDAVSLTVETAALDHVTITPAQVTLEPGQQQQFNSQGYDAYNNAISGLTYNWSVVDSDAGTIDASGLFTANLTGTYDDVIQVVVNGYPSISDTADVIVSNIPPTAVISGTPLSGVEGSTVTFDGSPSSAVGGSIVTYAWDWDYNGTTFVTDTLGVSAGHAWDDNGSFAVALRVVDDQGSQNVTSTLVTIANVAPDVELGGPHTTEPSQALTITPTVSDPGNDTFTYAWDLDDDGGFDDASTPTAVFSSMTTGLFTVSLRVQDDDGGVGSDYALIVVGNLAPIAVIADVPLTAPPNTPILFDGSPSYDIGGGIVSYAWDWDYTGSFVTDVVAISTTHQWENTGTYTVALRVTDDQGVSDLTTTQVVIRYFELFLPLVLRNP